jgi:hypothetical protein
MPIGNGGIIGVRNAPNPITGRASGLWTPQEIQQASEAGIWPYKAPVLSFIGYTQTTAASTNYTFSAHAVGPAAKGKVLVIWTGGRVASTSPIRFNTGLTVNGNNAVKAVESIGATSLVSSLYFIEYEGGTTADIVASHSDSMNSCAVAVWSILGLANPFPYRTACALEENTMSVDVPARGVLIAGSSMILSGGASCSITGLTEDFDAAIDSGENTFAAGGSYQNPNVSFEAGRSVLFDWTGSSPALKSVAASFR